MRQSLISLLEDAYEENHYTSMAATIMKESNRATTDEELFRILKRNYGPPTGRISRVVGKQLYEYSLRGDSSLEQIIQEAGELYDCRPEHLSDDQLCRSFSTMS